MVNFVIKNKDNEVVEAYNGAACFAPLWYIQDPTKRGATVIEYKPYVHGITREVALRYLAELKKTKFKITQSPEDILDKGFLIPLEDFRRKAGHISIPEIIGTLSVIRYVNECKPLIHKFLNLIDIDPEIDRWKALYSTSFLTNVTGKLQANESPSNGNHTISSAYEGVAPFKAWEEVEQAFDSVNTAWNGNHQGLCKHFGKVGGKIPQITVISKKEDFQKFESQCSK